MQGTLHCIKNAQGETKFRVETPYISASAIQPQEVYEFALTNQQLIGIAKKRPGVYELMIPIDHMHYNEKAERVERRPGGRCPRCHDCPDQDFPPKYHTLTQCQGCKRWFCNTGACHWDAHHDGVRTAAKNTTNTKRNRVQSVNLKKRKQQKRRRSKRISNRA